jgi:hypothetical protein
MVIQKLTPYLQLLGIEPFLILSKGLSCTQNLAVVKTVMLTDVQ